jgi:cytochrome c oxidase subunit 2
MTRATHRWVPGPAAIVAALVAWCVAGCHGPRAALSPATVEARRFGQIWWLFFGVGAVVFVVVMIFLIGAIVRARRLRASAATAPAAIVLEPSPQAERTTTLVVGSAVGITIALLFTLLIGDFALGRGLQPPVAADPLTIKITGHQWWWQIEYDDLTPSKTFQTGNEFHLPVGRPVQLILRSADVIHSFWFPNLQGKKDLIPGKVTTLWLQPDRAGSFRGQCAEFCGYQHAHMGLVATLESPEEFAKWQEAQRQPAREPQSDREKRGRDVFLSSSCVLCHTINGTPAASHVGPPLTHIGSAQTLAAGTVPNTREYLATWITDPQAIKPGTRMPANIFPPDDLLALVAYLQSLK